MNKGMKADVSDRRRWAGGIGQYHVPEPMSLWTRTIGSSLIVLIVTMATSVFHGAEALELIGSPIAISTAPGIQTFGAVAYNAADDQFLVVWSDSRNQATTGEDIYGQLVNADGTLAGGEIAISTVTANQTRPAVAYSTVANAFMVTWVDQRTAATTKADIFGRAIRNDGVLIGAEFPISNGVQDQNRARLAYDSMSNRFLSVWQDNRNGAKGDVFAQRIRPDGALAGGNFPIAAAPVVTEDRPEVAYNAIDQQYLVVFTDFGDSANSGSNISAQVVAPNGTLRGGKLPVSTAPDDQFRPHLAYDAVNNRFLVAYTTCENNPDPETCREPLAPGTDISAQLVDGDGVVVGGSIAIATEASPQYRPAAGFSSGDQLFVVVWTDERNGPADIFAQVIDPDGMPVGVNSPVSAASGGQHRPAMAYNPVDNRFLVVFLDRTNLSGQFVSPLP